MRLNDEEKKSIREAVLSRDPDAQIILFGSRVDDEQRGGDIDLLILSRKLSSTERRNIKLELYRRIGARKIDLVLAPDTSKPFVRLALEKGVAL